MIEYSELQIGCGQKEFTDRDELRCFLLAVYGIYRIQQ